MESLYQAACNGNLERARELLDQGHHLEETPLQYADRFNHVEIARTEDTADANRATDTGWLGMKRIRSYAPHHPPTSGAQTFAKRLRKAIRPILWPWGVASWGVAVQMKYIKYMEGVWCFVRLTMDPVSFVTKRKIGLDSCAPCRGVALAAGKNKQEGTTKYMYRRAK